MLKKIITTAVFLLATIMYVASQNITNYTFAATSGTFTVLTGGTSPSLSSGTADEGYFNAIPLGFNFYYMGTSYNSVSASTNGWLTLGANITTATPVNALSSGGAPRPIIAPLWDDLNLQTAANMSYSTTGTAGNRVFTIQFLSNKWLHTAAGYTISFQVKLYEANGKIEFVYRPESGSVVSASASIGIAATSTGSGNFLSLNNSGTNPSASSSNETTSINNKPSSGQTYSFTPVAPIAPSSLTYTGVFDNQMTLNWADNSGNEIGFVIYNSTDGVNYTLVTQTATNATSATITGLSGSTTYFWKIYTYTEGGSSAALTGSQATLCTPGAAPMVTSPVNYCQNATATQLTATGTGLVWGGVSGSVGGTAFFSTNVSVDNSENSKKTYFTTTQANEQITTIDYTIPAAQSVNGLVLSIFDANNTIVATSSTITTTTAVGSALKITNLFYSTLASAGTYSIGVSSGSGHIGYDNPSFPIIESTGAIYIGSVSSLGYRCFNNIQFKTATSSVAPVPSTAVAGSSTYLVSQTVAGCVSTQATITVNITTPAVSQIPTNSLVANFTFNGNANDVSGNNNNGLLQLAPALVADRFGNANSAYTLNGSTQYMTTTMQYTNPADFTLSIWFKTNTTSGGKLIGFGSSQIAQSNTYNRHIYMNNAGQIYFGVFPAAWKTINSTASYNDNNWHHATATLSSVSGMALYMDGSLVATDPTVTTCEATTGFWRVGFDNLNSWPSRPNSTYFRGAVDDILIYQRALTSPEVATVFTSPDGAGNNSPVCAGASINLSATTLAGATYAWVGPNSFTSSAQNPSFAYSAGAAGLYTLQVTQAGCTATSFTNVVAATTSGLWTGSQSTNWSVAGNWCSGVVPTATTNVVIPSTATNMPVISSSVSCNNITVNSGATLTTTLAGTLNIAGALTNNGTMNNNGTTVFNGTSGQQNFSGVSTFYNLTLNNTNGLLLPAAIVVANNLTLTAGILNANNFQISVGGNFTNNASSTALSAGTAAVVFNGTAAQSIGGTSITNFNNLTIASASVVSLARTQNVASNLTISSGTFDLTTYFANRLTAGGVLAIADNATLRIGGTNSFPANYSTITLTSASTVEYSGVNQTVSNQAYGNLKLSSSAGAVVKTLPASALTLTGNLISELGAGTSVTYTAAAAITVNGNVSIGASTIFNGSSFTHNVGGNWSNSGTFNGNTGTIVLSGTAATVSGTGNNFKNLTLAAPGIVFDNNAITVSGNFATTGTGSLVQNTGGSVNMTGTGATISGAGISIENLNISGTVTTSASFIVSGNLTVNGSLSASAGTITMSGGAETISGTGTISLSTLAVSGSVTTAKNITLSSGMNVSGSLTASAGTVTFTGTSAFAGSANLFNVTLNGTSLQMAANSILSVANTFAVTAGSVDVTTNVPNTINFNGVSSQSINGISTFNNLSINNAAGVTALNDITVNGVLNLAAANASASQGCLNLVSAWNGYPLLTNYVSRTLFMGASATTLGNGDVTGVVRRNTIVANTLYSFGSQYTNVSLTAGNMPTSFTIIIKIGSAPFGKTDAVSRHYELLPVAATNCFLTGNFHYLDNELNGNIESKLVTWDYDIAGGNGTPDEHGRAAYDFANNYVGMSNIPISYFIQTWRTVFSLGNYQQGYKTWNGSISTNWNNAPNWTPIGVPSMGSEVIIPDAATTNYDPELPTGATTINTMRIENGGVLVMANNTLVINNTLSGGWEDQNTAGNNPGTSTVVFSDIGATISGTSSFYNVEISDTASVALASGSTMKIANAISRTGSGSGLWNAGTYNGTVEFNGASQTIVLPNGVPAFHHLTLSGTGTKTVSASNLTLAGNFTNNATFDAGANTVTFDGTLPQTIQGTSVSTFNNIVIDNTAGVALAQDAVINNTLTLTTGAMNVNTHILSFATTATAVAGSLSATNMIIADGGGEVRKYGNSASEASFNFPVGDGSLSNNGAEYSPLALTFTGGTYTGGYTAVKINDNQHPADASTTNYISRYWTATPSDYSGYTCTLSGHYLSDDITGTENLIASAQRVGNIWTKYGTVDYSTHTINASCTSLGDFTGISNVIPTVVIAGGNTTVCKNDEATLTANVTYDSPVAYHWINGGETSSTIQPSTATAGSTTYTVSVTDGNGFSNTSNTTLVVNQNPTPAFAGNNKSACLMGLTLEANTPTEGTGVWSVISGPSINASQFSNINSPSATFVPDGGFGEYLLQWKTINAPCTESSSLVTITITNTGTWFGNNSNWFDPNNWCSGVPDSTIDVVIPASVSNMPYINATGARCHNITIESGSELKMDAAGDLIVFGNWSNSGFFNSGAGSITFAGTSVQHISGATSFDNIAVNNTFGVVLSNTIVINNTLVLQNGNIVTGANAVQIESSGYSIAVNGYVFGNLKQFVVSGEGISLYYPIGSATDFAPVDLFFDNVSAGNYVTVSTANGDHAQIASSGLNVNESVNRTWSLTDAGVNFDQYTVIVPILSGDIDPGYMPQYAGMMMYSANLWSVIPNTGSSTDFMLASGLTNFGDLQIGTVYPTPSLYWLNPGSGFRNQTANVELHGAGFLPGVSSVFVGTGITLNSMTVNSDTIITANIHVSSTALYGNVPFVVTNTYPGGGSSDTVNMDITPLPIPNFVATSTNIYCNQDGTTTFYNYSANSNSFYWNFGEGAVPATATGSGPFTVNYLTPGSKTVSLVVTNNEGIDSLVRTSYINVSDNVPETPAFINGHLGLCSYVGTNIVYTCPTAIGANFYNWTIPSGLTQVSGQGTTSLTVNPTANFFTGTLTVEAINGCGTSAGAASISLSGVQPLLSGGISGPAQVCGLVATDYSVPAIAVASVYTWSVPFGMTITTGQGTPNIHVTIVSSMVNGDVSVVVSNSCGASQPITLAVIRKPNAPGTITGNVSLCGVTQTTFSVSPVTGANSYTWTLPTGLTMASGSGTTNIVVNVASTFITGIVKVSAVNACGLVTGTAPLTVYGKVPTIPIVITGPTNLCGVTSANYSISAILGATGYNWTLPAGLTISSGLNTNSITVTNNGYSSGGISVAGYNICGTGPGRVLALTAAAPTPGAITGPAIVCGLTEASYSIAPLTGVPANGYQWNVPAGVTITGTSNTTSINVTIASGFNSGIISVIANNGCQLSALKQVTISRLTSLPGVITGPANVCGTTSATYSIVAVTGATGYVWVVPAGWTITSGQNTTSISVSFTGSGMAAGAVKVAAKNNCGTTTYRSFLTASCADVNQPEPSESNNNSFLVLYPNPATMSFTLDITSSVQKEITLEVYDVLGNKVKDELYSLNDGATSLITNIESLVKGVYFVRVTDNDNTILFKQSFIKQ